MISVVCEECGKQFMRYPCRLRRSPRVFCSPKCFSASVRGKPNPGRSQKYKGRFKGAKNPNFKGDGVSYGGLHRWVYRNLPKPTICPRCNKIPETGRIEAHNISGEYRRDPEDWIMVCTKCHQELDGRAERLRDNARFRDSRGRLIQGVSKIIDAESVQQRAIIDEMIDRGTRR
jgi:hypothetical protein